MLVRRASHRHCSLTTDFLSDSRSISPRQIKRERKINSRRRTKAFVIRELRPQLRPHARECSPRWKVKYPSSHRVPQRDLRANRKLFRVFSRGNEDRGTRRRRERERRRERMNERDKERKRKKETWMPRFPAWRRQRKQRGRDRPTGQQPMHSSRSIDFQLVSSSNFLLEQWERSGEKGEKHRDPAIAVIRARRIARMPVCPECC